MKVIIAGSREYNNYEELKTFCDEVLSGVEEIEIVSGAARGADLMGESYANERSYNIKRFPANWEKYGRSAGYIRNKEMAGYADALIAFWDGKSKGTSHMINLAKELGLKIRVFNFISKEIVEV